PPLPADVPGLLHYLERAVDDAEVVEVVCNHQAERWRRGERVPVEAYLWLHSRFRGNSQEAFELVYAEFALREHLGEAPALNEYVTRFPQFAERLRRQVRLHQALGPEGSFSSLPPKSSENQATMCITPSTAGSITGNVVPDVPGYEIIEELGRGGMG